MAETRCTTCGQVMTACGCPPPPLPDTTGRASQLQRGRETVCGWLGGHPQQHNPTVRAWVDAELARARTADEATIQAMLTQYDLLPHGRQGTGRYATAALFLHDVLPILQECHRRREHPSLPKVAARLPTTCDEKQLRRIVKRLFGVTWREFRRRYVGPMA